MLVGRAGNCPVQRGLVPECELPQAAGAASREQPQARANPTFKASAACWTLGILKRPKELRSQVESGYRQEPRPLLTSQKLSVTSSEASS